MQKKIKSLVFLVLMISNFCFSQQGEQEISPSILADTTSLMVLESVISHNLNPQTTAYTSDSMILSGLYEGLFSNNPQTLDPEPGIAVDFRLSRDKKRWTFTLRDNAYFSNGQLIDAEAVRKSFLKLLKDPDAPYSSLLDIIKGAEAFRKGFGSEENVGITVTAPNRICFTLVSPANYFMRVLCHAAFSIVHDDPQVFSGAYVIDSYQDGQIVLRKNNYYWDSANTKLETITFIQSDDAELNAALYNSGVVDWIATGSVDVDKIINKKAVQYSAEFGTSYLFFKLKEESSPYVDEDSEITFLEEEKYIWNKPEFRNAVLEAIPWDSLRGNSFVPATTFVFPLNGYPQVDGFSYTDIVEAKALMKEARELYEVSQDEIIPLVFEIPSNFMSESIKQQLAESLSVLGIDLQFRELPNSMYIRNVPASDADLFVYNWIGDFADPLAFLELFRGGSTLNASRWQNNEFDELIAQAAVSSTEQRFVILAQAETILLDSGMVIPIYHPVSFNVVNTEAVGGWIGNAFDFHPLKYLYKNIVEIKLPNVVLNN